MADIWILGQAETDMAPSNIGSTAVGEETESGVKVDPNVPAGKGRQGPFMPGQWIFIAVMVVLMYVILFRGPRKKEQQHKHMVQSLQKNDKVRTIGGIIGTVVDIKDDEITLKVDESNNTKIKVMPTAIGKNISRDEK